MPSQTQSSLKHRIAASRTKDFVSNGSLSCLSDIEPFAYNNASPAKLLTARAVATRLGVSTETVLRWTRHGALPAFRHPGGALRYQEDALEAWLAERATASEPRPRNGGTPRPPRELSPDRTPEQRGDDRDATDAARTGVQAELW